MSSKKDPAAKKEKNKKGSTLTGKLKGKPQQAPQPAATSGKKGSGKGKAAAEAAAAPAQEAEPEAVNKAGENVEAVARRLQLTPAKVKEYREAFAMFDKDNNGEISAQELGQIMKSLGQEPNTQDLKKMIECVDKDGSDSIDFLEFLDMMSEFEKQSGNADDEIREAFKVFDKDGDGFISLPELKQVMHTLGERLTDTEIADMIKEADTDGDGRVNYNEFLSMMTNKMGE